MVWKPARILAVVAIGMTLSLGAAEASIVFLPQCRPDKAITFSVPENPRFIVKKMELKEFQATTLTDKRLPTSSKELDPWYSQVTISAAAGTRFRVTAGSLVESRGCLLFGSDDIDFQVRRKWSTPKSRPTVRNIDFDTADVQLASAATGWHQVDIANSEQDLQAGRIATYFDWTDTHSYGLYKAFGKGDRRGPVANGAISAGNGNVLEMMGRLSPYVVRVTPHYFDGSQGPPWIGWVKPSQGGFARGPLPLNSTSESDCSKNKRAARIPRRIPSDAELLVLQDHRMGELRSHYPYARTPSGQFLDVDITFQKHPTARAARSDYLYRVKAPAQTTFEFGFLPYEDRCRPQKTVKANHRLPRPGQATSLLQTTISARAWSPHEVVNIEARRNENNPYVEYRGTYVEVSFSSEVGAPTKLEWSSDGIHFEELPEPTPGSLGASRIPTKHLPRDVLTIYVKATPQWTQGDAQSWFGWFWLTSASHPTDATKNIQTTTWGRGLKAGDSIQGENSQIVWR